VARALHGQVGMRSVVLFATIVLAACMPLVDPAPQDARIDVVNLSVERLGAERVRLTLHNGGAQAVGYNLCASGLEVRTVSAWQPVRTGEVCTMELRSLPPGQDATFEKRLPLNLPDGEYRYVTRVEIPIGSEQVSITSRPFQFR
jgi:hypothetical protein